ncbi:MAG: YihY family inner membrane protein [Alphaproteobacteria bacterium]
MDEKRLNRLTDELQFARTVVRRFSQDRVLVTTASLSYTSLLAIVPLFAIAFSVMMAFLVFDGMTQQLLSIVLSDTASHIGGELETYVDRFVSNTSELMTLGVVWLAVTAVMLLSTIETAFNAIWRIEKPRPLAMRLVAYWTTLTLGPLLLGAGLSVSTAFAMNNFMPLGLDFGAIRNFFLRMLPFLFAVGGFAILYLALPNRRVGVRYALLGALQTIGCLLTACSTRLAATGPVSDWFWKGCRIRDTWRVRMKTSRCWSVISMVSPWPIYTSRSAMGRAHPISITMKTGAGPRRWLIWSPPTTPRGT